LPPEPASCIAQLFFAEVRRLNHPAQVIDPTISVVAIAGSGTPRFSFRFKSGR
jgi:hypothetical protein